MDRELKRLLQAAADGDEAALERLAGVFRRRNHGLPSNDHERMLELLACEHWIDAAALARLSPTAHLAVAAWIRQQLVNWQGEDAIALFVEERDDAAWILDMEGWRIAVQAGDPPWVEWLRTPSGVLLFKQETPRVHIFASQRDPLALWLLAESEGAVLEPARQVAEALRAAGSLVEGVARARNPGEAVRSAESFVQRLLDISRNRG